MLISRNKSLKACLLISMLLMLSCTGNIQNKAGLVKYLNDPSNGLQKTERVGEVQVKLTYQPWQLIAANLLKNKQEDSTARRQLEDFKGKYFFILSLSKNNKELIRQLDYNTYSEMVQVLSFRMIPFISVISDNGKSYSPMDCLFQQTYGMSDSNNLLIVFDKAPIEQSKTLRLSISEFGLNLGNLNFELKTSDINHLKDLDYRKLL